MNTRSLIQNKLKSSFTPIQSGLLQRKCQTCGQHAIAGRNCTGCAKQKSGLQRKLVIGAAHDPLEREADQVADQVMSKATHQSPSGTPRHIQRYPGQMTRSTDTAPASVDNVLASPGRPLDRSLRQDMGQRFGHDFSQVRVHTDPAAQGSAQDVDASAYTVGNSIVFGAGQYAPKTSQGQWLIAHELAHTLQQQQTPRLQRYTEAERREMAEGRITARQSDIDLANQRHFQPGDIVFRLGSVPLGLLMGEPVTHGGIYIGNGLIHDVVGFGNRHVRVSDFFNTALGEAADSSVYRLVRFRGPHRDLIVPRLLSNISRRDFRMPTDPVPFNLFSSAGDYGTATCLEYTHAQFLYAIRQLSADPAVPASDRESIRRTYFTGGAAEPNALIQPQEQRLIGNMVDPSGGTAMGNGGLGYPPPRTPSALVQEGVLVTAATALASDVDPARFRNRSESRYTQHWPGGSGIGGSILNFILGPSHDEVVLQTFTYRSFVDSRQFFEDVTTN